MRWVFAAFYVAAGIAHLRAPDKLLAITPSWVPFAPQVIFLTGLFEFASSLRCSPRRCANGPASRWRCMRCGVAGEFQGCTGRHRRA